MLKAFLDRHRFATFAVATLAWSWVCWLPVLHAIDGEVFKSPPGVLALFFAGAYGPSLWAIILAAYFDGRNGLRELFRRRLGTMAALRWSVLVLLAAPLLYGGALVLFAATGGTPGPANHGLWPWVPAIMLVSLFLGPLAEEFGWRGFAIRQFDLDREFTRANVLIGLLWAVWHAPLWWAATGTAISGMPLTPGHVALFIAAVLGSTWLYAWAWQRTGGSVLVAVMLHLGLNSGGTITAWLFPELPAAQKPHLYAAYVACVWLLVGLLWLVLRSRGRARG